MSLLEVLISIFAISIGMMGVAALIPVGQLSVIEATKADRSAACGRAAMAEVKVRNMLDPVAFRNPTDGSPMGAWLDTGSTIVIDPLFSAQPDHVGQTYTQRFPYDGNWDGSKVEAVRPIPRVTLPGTNTLVMLYSVADRVFTWRDDLIFDIDAADPLKRPRQSYLWDTDATAPAPILATDKSPPSGNRVQPNVKGDYTWLLTVTPAATEIGSTNKRKFDVSVVVIFGRDLSHNPTDARPSERATAGIAGLGYGGGDGILIAPDKMKEADATEYLAVRQNEWVMVTGLVKDSRLDSPAGAGNGYRRIAKWYRAVAVDEQTEFVAKPYDRWTRRVTLAGPDWDPACVMPQAVLIRGVVGVYTKTIELDRDSKWNP
ncbi:MAG: hypothetical protein NTW96_02200 [Planctomycetia bacterium]|nr:hypothetical protein [Planctomycetia bacterium]